MAEEGDSIGEDGRHDLMSCPGEQGGQVERRGDREGGETFEGELGRDGEGQDVDLGRERKVRRRGFFGGG